MESSTMLCNIISVVSGWEDGLVICLANMEYFLIQVANASMWQCILVTTALGIQSQADHWGSLDSHSGLLREFRAKMIHLILGPKKKGNNVS